jgi:hypothetical protein
MLKKQIAELLSAEDMAAGSVTSEGLRKEINCTQKFCKELKMKMNAIDKDHSV